MSVIDSSRAKPTLGVAWLAFAIVNATSMFMLPGEETIPYHLIWASFGLLYGFYAWSAKTTWITFSTITLVTGTALVKHAQTGIIGWEECSEIVLMGVLVALLIWHVDRHRLAQDRLRDLREAERARAENREVAARFGSHEVRTRLTIARGFAEMIRDKSHDETTRSDAAVVLRELDKASALTTKLLTLVRVETPTARLPVNLADLVSAILMRWEVTADRNWSADIRVGMMLGDAERFEAALDCLIENAVKFTSAGDSIRIRAHADRDDVCICVEDTGAGIPARDVARVTEVFNTGSAAGERAGSGLGLAIVLAIVQGRGGTLEVTSAEGSGTSVTIRLPGGYPADVRRPAQRTLAEAEAVIG